MRRFRLVLMVTAVSAAASGCLTVSSSSPGGRTVPAVPWPASAPPVLPLASPSPSPARNTPATAPPREHRAARPAPPAPDPGTDPAGPTADQPTPPARPPAAAPRQGRPAGAPAATVPRRGAPAPSSPGGRSGACALGSHYGGWATGSEADRICHAWYGG